MPPLTWRDTAAPDFSTTLGALRQSGDSLHQAFGGLGDALGRFNDYSQGRNASALMANAVKYNNPADLQAAFANGSIMDGVNPGYLTADALQRTQGQVGTLLSNATNAQNLDYNKQADPLRINALQDQQTVNAGTQAARIATPDLLNKGTAANTSFTNANTGLVGDQAARERQVTEQGATLFGRGTADYQAGLDALPLIRQLQTGTMTPDSIRALPASPEYQGLSEMAKARVDAALAPYLNGSAGASGMIAGAAGQPGAVRQAAGATAAPPPTDPFGLIPSANGSGKSGPSHFMSNVPFDETRNYVPKILSAAGPLTGSNEDKVNQLLPHLIQQESSGNPNAVSSKGAAGLTGIMPKTGIDPGNKVTPLPANATPAQQKTFGHDYLLAMMNKYKGDPEKALAAYNAGPTAVDGWIANGPRSIDADNQKLNDLRSDLVGRGIDAGKATRGIQQALAQRGATSTQQTLETTQQDQSDSGAVAARMLAKDKDGNSTSGSAYSSATQKILVDELEYIKKYSPGMTSTTAAAIMEKHPESVDFLTHPALWLKGLQNTINASGVKGESDAFNNNSLYVGAEADNSASATGGAISAAMLAHTVAATDYANGLHNRTLAPEQLTALENKTNLTRARLDFLLKVQKSDPTLNFRQNTPTPVDPKTDSVPSNPAPDLIQAAVNSPDAAAAAQQAAPQTLRQQAAALYAKQKAITDVQTQQAALDRLARVQQMLDLARDTSGLNPHRMFASDPRNQIAARTQ
jgi:soluble lytic murein transglycosylase-like protein